MDTDINIHKLNKWILNTESHLVSLYFMLNEVPVVDIRLVLFKEIHLLLIRLLICNVSITVQ